MMELTEKLTLHIPRQAFRDGKLETVDYRAFAYRLSDALEAIGIEAWHMMAATGYYKGRVYSQDLLTVFCEPFKADAVERVFLDAYQRDDLGQESFAYEKNGVLHIVPLGAT